MAVAALGKANIQLPATFCTLAELLIRLPVEIKWMALKVRRGELS